VAPTEGACAHDLVEEEAGEQERAADRNDDDVSATLREAPTEDSHDNEND